MKMCKTLLLAGVVALFTTPTLADPASDVFAFFQKATAADIAQAQAIYAANPNVPTAPAATQCLNWASLVINSGVSAPFSLQVPSGAVSALADLDVALSNTSNAPPAIVEAFNKNCGWYVEDLKAEAAVHASHFVLFGVKFF